jgi:predicted MFS family arabinose efflux permease
MSFFLAAAAGSSIILFHAAFVAMALLGAGSNPVSWTRGIAMSFKYQLGLALGLTLTGTGICAILIPQLTTWMIGQYGVQNALAVLGAVPLLVALPLVFQFFRPVDVHLDSVVKTGSAGDGLTLKAALRTYRFWALFLSVACIYLAQAGIITNLIPTITDHGFSIQEAANFQSILGISMIVGRIGVGALLDRLWAPGVAAVVTCLPLIACLIIPTSTSFTFIFMGTTLLGITAGAELDFLAFMTAKYFGLRYYATIYAIIYAALAIAGGLGPFAFAVTYDRFHTYAAAFNIAACLYGFGSLIILTLGPYPEAFRTPSRKRAPPKMFDTSLES